jgi:hypothetical protein
MSLPDYNLNAHIGWATTRRIPLCEAAVSELLILVTNTYTTFIEEFAGISNNNALEYLYPLNNISNNQDFFNEAELIIIPHNLLNIIEFDYFLNNALLNNAHLTFLLNTVEMTPQFSGFLTQLEGINQTNNQDYEYRNVIELMMLCPKFLRDAETFLVTP